MIEPSTAARVETEIPAQRPDFEGQNIEAVRFKISQRIRELVAQLNKEMKDARTAGLTVYVHHNALYGAEDASVSIYENRRY